MAQPDADFCPIERCDAVARDMPQKPEIRLGEARAWYSPGSDLVNMPRPELFTSSEEYYSTLFHELSRATGRPDRLNRKGQLM